MSGIPGLTGATPVQNVGAYGSEVADVDHPAARARPRDRRGRRLGARACGFGFRTSAFKHTDRYVVLDVTFALPRRRSRRRSATSSWRAGSASSRATRRRPTDVREVVLELRRSKGMVLDPDDHDTWSVGSFFVNPFVAPDAVPDGCPHWAVDGQIKLSAAWLIENAGFGKGYGDGPACAVSTKHTLALTNRGGATTAELLDAGPRDPRRRRGAVRRPAASRGAPRGRHPLSMSRGATLCGAAWASGLTTSRSMFTCAGRVTANAMQSAMSSAVSGSSTPA